jgi:hypothetical protein
VKTKSFLGVGTSGRGMGTRKWGMRWMCFVAIYEHRRMKPVEIVLRRGGGGAKRENDRGVKLTKIYFKHICKYHNVSPIQLLYANKIISKKKNLILH